MPLTRDMPGLAKPMLNRIRREVPKPRLKPRRVLRGAYGNKVIRWSDRALDFPCFRLSPMGMLLKARHRCPSMVEGTSQKAGWCFSKWFDEQYDIDATMEAIWPTEQETTCKP